MIVADTGGIIALLDRDDRHHGVVRRLFEASGAWVLPWAVLPEVDYLASTRLGDAVALAFAHDVQDGVFTVDGQVTRDLPRAVALLDQYQDLRIGLVDAVVMAQAERHQARVIVTTDAKHFRAVALKIKPKPRLVPLDE